MMTPQNIRFDGTPYTFLLRDDYDRLTMWLTPRTCRRYRSRKRRETILQSTRRGRAWLERIIRDRDAVGERQRLLALRAGVRVEKPCRIETGKHTPGVPTIDKINWVLKAAKQQQDGRGLKRKAPKGICAVAGASHNKNGVRTAEAAQTRVASRAT